MQMAFAEAMTLLGVPAELHQLMTCETDSGNYPEEELSGA
jgi:hypothetical protein